ncbi:MAG: LPS assembly protein LptD, partial [Planctomycetota bacterium]
PIDPADLELPTTVPLPVEETPTWLRDPDARIRFSAETLQYTPGADEDIITATGSIAIVYRTPDAEEDWRELSLVAERAVVFLEPGSNDAATSSDVSADSVRGIYLEGNVIVNANRDQYRLRAPQAYYDFESGRAIMLEAILRTYSRASRIPVHARAKEMRQVAEDQWTAKQVRVSTSEFFTPHFAVGAERMTITQRPSAKNPDDTETHFDSRDNTFRVGGTPIFGWPKFSGTLQRIPLRSVQIGTRDNSGVEIETSWDLFGLLGIDAPNTMDAELKIDGRTERGAAVGLVFSYEDLYGEGVVDLYGMWDDGVDRTDAGIEVDPDSSFRGVALWEHQKRVGENWTLQSQASVISDETFIPTFREDAFFERREYETSAYAKWQNGNSAFTALAKYDVNGFLSNDYLIASRQYSVDRLPEVSLRKYGATLFGGKVVYSSESRASYMRLQLEDNSPAELGIRPAGFGIGANTPLSDALIAQGFNEDWVGRFDSRHEFSMPSTIGIFKVVPFLVGRATAYTEDFETFSSDAESTRAHGAAGIYVGTQFQHVNNSVENQLLGLHRIRHIIEPSITAWYGESNVDETDLPEYDPEVESIATGGTVRLGMRNTWQTKRGGPGRWRSVDVFTLDTDVYLTTSDHNKESPTPQFFDYRPEYSQLGNAARTAGILRFSDSLSLSGETVYDFDRSRIQRGAIGMLMDHSPRLQSYIEYRFIDASETELLGVLWLYELTPTYKISFRPEWDFEASEFRAVRFGVERRFTDFTVQVVVRRDEIRDDTTFSARLNVLEF